MPAPTDPAIWRTHPYVFETLLWIDKPPVVFACRVNQAITTNSFPIADITYDGVTTGAYTDCWAHQLALFGSAPGLDDLGRGRLRKAPNATTLFIGRSSQGIHDGECNIVDDSYLTVLDTFLPWARIPWIADGITQNGASVPLITTQYRDWDLDYTVGVNGHPQVNLGYGSGFLGEVDPVTNLLTVSFPLVSGLSKGYDSNIVSWVVTAPDGSQSGSVPNVTYIFPPGRRHVHFTATDANGNSLTRHILVVSAKDGTAFEAIKYFEMSSQKLELDGNKNQCSITVYQNIPASTYIDKAMVIVAENEWYGSTQGPINVVSNLGQTGSETIKFCGWMYDANNSTVTNSDGTLSTVILTCYDICGWLDKLPGFPIEINRMATVTSWLQQKNANIDKYLAESIALYFSTVRYITDFYDTNTGDIYGISRLGSGQQTLYATFQEFADRAIGYEFTANEQGMIQIHPNQNLLPANLRTNINILTVTEDDLISIDHTDIRHPRNHWNRGAAIISSTVDITSIVTPQTAFAVAPGKGPGQGPTEKDSNEQLVISSGELFTREAGRAAEDNSPIGDIRLKFAHVGDAGIEPALGQWLTINISSQYAAQRGIQFTNARTRILSVTTTRVASPDGNTKEFEAICRPETFGVAAVDDTPPISNTAQEPPVAPPLEPIITFPIPGLDGKTSIALDENLIFKVSTDNGVHWNAVSYSGYTDGGPAHVELDPESPYLTTGAGSLNIYLVASQGLWYGIDILNAGVYTLTLANSNNGGGMVKPDTTTADGGVVSFNHNAGGNNSSDLIRFTGHGSSVVWTKHGRQVGVSDFSGYLSGSMLFDINQNGIDEVVVQASNTSGGTSLWQVLNGNAPTVLHTGSTFSHSGAMQRPLKTPLNVTNLSTGSSEYFIYTNNGLVFKTNNGGGLVVNISPPIQLGDFGADNVFVPSDNGQVIIIVGRGGGTIQVAYSIDAGVSWKTSPVHSGSASSSEIVKLQMNNTYKVYFISNDLTAVSTQDLTVWEIWTGNWGATGGGWYYFIPLA